MWEFHFSSLNTRRDEQPYTTLRPSVLFYLVGQITSENRIKRKRMRNGFRASCLLLFCLGKVRISYLIQGKEERWKVSSCQIEIVWVFSLPKVVSFWKADFSLVLTGCKRTGNPCLAPWTLNPICASGSNPQQNKEWNEWMKAMTMPPVGRSRNRCWRSWFMGS